MTLDNNQQAELDHLIRFAQTHPNMREYADWKANARATKYPVEWGWLPLALSNALDSSSGTSSGTAASSAAKPESGGRSGMPTKTGTRGGI